MLIRPGEPRDAERIAALVAECDDELTRWIPGWKPPPVESEREKATMVLTSGLHWVRIAEENEAIAGYVVWRPDDGFAHLGRLFVHPSHWGDGIATTLHGQALTAAQDFGFTSMRLFT